MYYRFGSLNHASAAIVNNEPAFLEITAVEAIVPMNANSGRGLGVRARAHLYLPDFFGKPTFGN
jgi:hypothetical protein